MRIAHSRILEGSQRFGPPTPVTPWTEERDASVWGDVKCVQYGFLYDGDVDVQGTEDCLYLSVYTPQNATKGRECSKCPLFNPLHDQI